MGISEEHDDHVPTMLQALLKLAKAYPDIATQFFIKDVVDTVCLDRRCLNTFQALCDNPDMLDIVCNILGKKGFFENDTSGKKPVVPEASK